MKTMSATNTWKRRDSYQAINIILVFSTVLFTEQVESTTLLMIIFFLLIQNYSKDKWKKLST